MAALNVKNKHNVVKNLYCRQLTYYLQVLELSNFCWQELKVIVTKVQGTQCFCN